MKMDEIDLWDVLIKLNGAPDKEGMVCFTVEEVDKMMGAVAKAIVGFGCRRGGEGCWL